MLNVSLFFYSIDVDSSESFLHSGELPTLIIQSAGHTLHVFVNGELCGRPSSMAVFQILLW